MPAPRFTLALVRPEFISTAEVEARTGRKARSVRNDCIEEGIALPVTRPCGGTEWAIHEDGYCAASGDTGYPAGYADAVRCHVERLAAYTPLDTGPVLDIRPLAR
jgi:hypothetical protein